MKKFVLLCLTTLLSVFAWAYDFEENGIYYNKVAGGVEVTWGGTSNSSGTESYTGDLTIPSTASDGMTTYTVTGIGQYAFRSCTITGIHLPETITSMGTYSFYGCKSLTELTFPAGLTTIPSNCCHNCSTMTSVTLPECLTTIDSEAFENCPILPEIILPDGLTTIGNSAFYDCRKLDNLVLPNGPLSIGDGAFNSCGLTSVYIPATITYMGYNAFSNNEYLSEITLEEGLTYLGNYAFSSAYSLEYLFIPNTITYMGEGVFCYCEALSEIEFEEGLTFIGDYVFDGCYSLGKVVLPEGVVSIGEGAFSGCEKLSSVTLPSTLTSIGNNAFNRNLSLESFTIPGTLTYVGESMFADCYNLSEVILENGVPYISDYMFTGCEALTTIEFPNTITSIGKYAFYSDHLTAIKLPASCKTIKDYAFAYNAEATQLSLPEGLEYIGDNAFRQIMSSMDSEEVIITIPESVTYIGSQAFYHCSNLKELNILANIDEIRASTFYQSTSLTTVSIPKMVVNIGNQAFYNSSKITSFISYNHEAPICGSNVFSSGIMSECTLYVPDGSEEAYGSAPTWKSFTNIVGIEVDDDSDEEETKFVEEGIYYQYVDKDAKTVEVTYKSTVFNYYIDSVTIPATVTHNEIEYTVVGIGENAFRLSPDLIEVIISEGITYIDTRAFYECTALNRISLPQGLIDIGMSVFYHCASLTEITIPATVTSIKGSAFSSCTSLSELSIPASVISIGNTIISGCSSMEKLILEDGENPLEVSIPNSSSTSFSDCPFSSLYLGRTLSYERVAGNYSPFYKFTSLKNITFGEQEITLGDYLFYNTGVEELYIPENVTIGKNAFWACNSLKSAVVGATSIGTYAFNDCTSLSEVTLLETITSIAIQAFYYCDALEEVTIACNPSGCYECFYHCTALKKVTLTKNVNRVRDYMFYNGKYIEEIYSFNPTPPTLVENSFNNIYTETCMVYVPIGAYDDYKVADIWEDFFNIVEMSEFAIETLEATDVTDTSATLNGTVTAAYDAPITEKGFEYWTGNEEALKAVVEGDEMTATVTDLTYDTKYTYRAYATTATDTYYGEEVEFETAVPDGISNVNLNDENIDGIYSTSGQKLSTTQSGVNIVKYNDGTVKKIYVK